MLRCLNQYFRNTTEMEAVLRVAVIVIQAVEGLPDVQVQLQPSVNSHADFYFLIESQFGKAFIQVKKSSVAVQMQPSPSVAQAFREAHILLCEGKMEEKSTVPLTSTRGPLHWQRNVDQRLQLRKGFLFMLTMMLLNHLGINK